MKTQSLSITQPLLGRALPQWVNDLLGSVPKRGGGFNNWLFRAALALHPYRTEDEIRAILENAAAACDGAVRADEIPRAIANSKASAWKGGTNGRNDSSTSKVETNAGWPKADAAAINRLITDPDSPGLVDLWERSPLRLHDADNGSHCEVIIDALFPGNPLLCVGRSSQSFDTRPREAWRGELAGSQLIVPSPMSKLRGEKKEGGLSAHTLDNTGSRCFLVVEFDSGNFDEHAGLLWHLAHHAPLALAVHSGSKSIHGWFCCAGQSEDTLRRFMRYAVRLGADPATWTRSQFVRMPDGLRDNGNPQSVLFFNPAVLPAVQAEPSNE